MQKRVEIVDNRNDSENGSAILSQIGESRRDSVRKLLIGGAYAIPAIALFSLAGLSVAKAANYGGNT